MWAQLKRATKEIWVEKSETHREIGLPGGGRVSVRSADDPDSLRGEGLDGAVLDEGFFQKPEIWFNVIRPALSDKNGWAVFATTPNGFNWGKDLFDAAPALAEWSRWQLPTWDNPLIPRSEIDEARRTLPPFTFRQEYGAEFVKQEGVEWPGEYFNDSIWYDGQPPATETLCRVMALDPSLGRTDKSDYSAMIFATVLHNGQVWVDADIARRDAPTMASDGLTHYQRFQPDCWACEVNGFAALDSLIAHLATNRKIINLRFARVTQHQNKLARIRLGVGPALASGRIRFRRGSPGCSLLVSQLKDFPVGEHDDGPDALELAIRVADELIANGGLPPGAELMPQRIYA